MFTQVAAKRIIDIIPATIEETFIVPLCVFPADKQLFDDGNEYAVKLLSLSAATLRKKHELEESSVRLAEAKKKAKMIVLDL